MDSTISKKVDVLLKEYDALRAEIISRSNGRLAVSGYIVALAALAGTRLEPRDSFVVLFAVGLMILMVWVRLGWLIARCGRRIAEIEKQVNTLMEDRLLVWESRMWDDPRHRIAWLQRVYDRWRKKGG